MRAPALVAVVSILLAPTLPADQLHVGPAGSGAPFAEIAAALAVAKPGDVVLVAPGSYGPFVVDGPATVVGAGHALVLVAQGAGVAGLRVTGLAPGEAAQVSGLTVSAGLGVATPFPHVEVAGNAGRVVLSDVHAGTLATFPSSGATQGPTAVVVDSASVLLDGCRLRGFTAPPSQPNLAGQGALVVTRSHVWIADSQLAGAGGGSQFQNGGPGAPALVALDSSVHLARSEALGGHGGVVWGFDPLLTYGWDGAEGILLSGSALALAGGPQNRVRGGAGPLVGPEPWSWYAGGPGVRVGGASSARAAVDADVENGMNGDGSVYPGGFAVQAGGTLQVESYALPTVDLLPTLPAPGDAFALVVAGAPSTLQLAFWAPSLGTPTPLPGLGELVALPLAEVQLLAAVQTAANGLGAHPGSVPWQPWLSGAALVVQAVELGPNGPLLSNPTSLAVR